MNEESRPQAAPQTPAKASNCSVQPDGDDGWQAAPFQVLPPLSEVEYTALREDIAANGMLVPVLRDERHRIVDGHHRVQIAHDLGITDYPVEILVGRTDDQLLDHALTLNCARRHLTGKQVRVVIQSEITRRPADSDRAIARRIGCSPSTVGAVRNPVSNLDTPPAATVADARAATDAAAATLVKVREMVAILLYRGLSNKVPPADLVMALTTAQREFERRSPSDVNAAFRIAVFTPLVDMLLDPANVEYFRSQWEHETFKPLTEDEHAELLASIASLGCPR